MHALAARAGLSTGYVSLLEGGTWEDPRCSTVAKLAAALQVTTDWLILGSGEPDWSAPLPEDERPGVYFVRSEGDGSVKIGFSVRPSLRVQQLRTSSPHALILIAIMPGDKRDERALHRRFRSARIHGEWFRPVPELLAFIEAKSEAA